MDRDYILTHVNDNSQQQWWQIPLKHLPHAKRDSKHFVCINIQPCEVSNIIIIIIFSGKGTKAQGYEIYFLLLETTQSNAWTLQTGHSFAVLLRAIQRKQQAPVRNWEAKAGIHPVKEL